MSEETKVLPEKRVFTEIELSLMKKLGLTPDKISSLGNAVEKKERRVREKKKNCMLSEYYLKHVSICKLCGGAKVSYFKMEKEFTPDGSFLHSKPVSKEEFEAAEKTDKKVDEHLTCSNCSENLNGRSKEDLIALCITLQRRFLK